MPANCMIIDAEMYGIIPKAKMEARENAPPVNILNRSAIPPPPAEEEEAKISELTPGNTT